MLLILICLLFCIGCANTAIKPEAYPKENLKTYKVGKVIEFVGIKNNDSLKNSYGYSYFTEAMANSFEKQSLMKDRSGYLADEINLTSLQQYNTNNRYIAFAEIKDYNFLITENKEDIDGLTHAILGIYTLGIGNLIAEAYESSNRLTYIGYTLDANFYLYDKKTERIIKKIPVSIKDKSTISGSWNNTDETGRKNISKSYLNHIYNIIAEQLKTKL